MAQRKKLGLIVNPVAGVGGRVGLKGSDGTDILRRALELGAARESPRRAQQALTRLHALASEIDVVTCPAEMGADEARAAGFSPQVLDAVIAPSGEHLADGSSATSAADTERAARALLDLGVDLLLFAGGDGTARNIHNAVGASLPVVGIPAGVKIHSAVYATTPAAAGDLAALFFRPQSRGIELREAEVMDIDEEAFRHDRLSARLYGYLTVPYLRSLLQSAKAGAASSDVAILEGIASEVINTMAPGRLYVIGPGTTTRGIMRLLRLPNTLLGVDVVCDRALAASDVNENELLRLTEGRPATVVVTVIGGQGHIFGRGNQQISPKVLRQVGLGNITVVATSEKLLGLEGRPLLVDTGDEELDTELCGFRKVVTNLNEMTVYPVSTEAG
jgi:predicted polyphosphate/ATP-dependent NAD kinase